jgi:S-adenosylmethionine synthetase
MTYHKADHRNHYIFTSESVSEGHPDKVCDQISDSVVDLMLAANPHAHIAVETLATTNHITLAGEVSGADAVSQKEIENAARDVVRRIGYEQEGFHADHLSINYLIHQQSADIAQGVGKGDDEDAGAGDQGIMFGYACTETEHYMPAPIYYANEILKKLAHTRHADAKSILRPDAKSQVSLVYEDGKPTRASSIVVSTQHQAGITQSDIRELVREHVLAVLPEGWMPEEKEFYVNPTGNFVIGGPDGDAGLTGRKIIVDTYGGAAPHGGGAFSGKDPTKVDRSAAYAARYLAKNVVAAGLAERCVIQLSYAIGVAHPISLYVNAFGTARVAGAELEKILPQLMDLSPRGIRKHLQLNRPIYSETASYGHFGRTPTAEGHFSWEKLDLVDELKRHFGAS